MARLILRKVKDRAPQLEEGPDVAVTRGDEEQRRLHYISVPFSRIAGPCSVIYRGEVWNYTGEAHSGLAHISRVNPDTYSITGVLVREDTYTLVTQDAPLDLDMTRGCLVSVPRAVVPVGYLFLPDSSDPQNPMVKVRRSDGHEGVLWNLRTRRYLWESSLLRPNVYITGEDARALGVPVEG